MFALIMIDIWLVEPFAHMTWLALVALAIASHVRRGEGPAALGFRRANFLRCLVAMTPLLFGIGALALGLGLAVGTVRHATPGRLATFIAYYCAWGVVQQYALNGYFVNRFAAAAEGRGRAAARAVPFVAAACFALAHAPNWFLTGVTLGAGWLCATYYLRYRNLYPLGIAHGLLGTALFFTVPDSVSHHFHVGPGVARWDREHARPRGARDGAAAAHPERGAVPPTPP